MIFVRRFLAVAAVAGAVAGCSSTEATPPVPGFGGTIFADRWSSSAGPEEAPVGIDGLNREFQVPVDLSTYYPGDTPETFPSLIIDFDVTRDGRYLYVAARTKILRYSLPTGEPWREVGDYGIVDAVQVSPDGRHIAFRRAIGHDIWVMSSDGSGLHRVLAAEGNKGLSPPVWVGNDRVMIVVDSTNPERHRTESKVMEAHYPDWIARDYTPLNGLWVGGLKGDLAASPDGLRLYLIGFNIAGREIVTEYQIGNSTGVQRVLFPPNGASSMVISPDGGHLAAALGDSVGIYDLATGARVALVPGKEGRNDIPIAWTSAEYPEVVGR